MVAENVSPTTPWRCSPPSSRTPWATSWRCIRTGSPWISRTLNEERHDHGDRRAGTDRKIDTYRGASGADRAPQTQGPAVGQGADRGRRVRTGGERRAGGGAAAGRELAHQ